MWAGVHRTVKLLPRLWSSPTVAIAALAKAWAGPHRSCRVLEIATWEAEEMVYTRPNSSLIKELDCSQNRRDLRVEYLLF